MTRSWVERYAAGECTDVWAEMTALGKSIQQEPRRTEALTVCRELTRRSRINLMTLVRRLHDIGYEFWSDSEGAFFRLTSLESENPWMRSELWQIGSNVEHRNDYPLVVSQWVHDIGRISLRGRHPELLPQVPDVYPDPLVVDEYFDEFEEDPTEDYCGEPGPDYGVSWLYIAEPAWKKSNLGWETGCDLERDNYRMRCPTNSVDGSIENCWLDTTFAGYIRRSFQWGGFPGWERYPDRPERLLAFLRKGLLPVRVGIRRHKLDH